MPNSTWNEFIEVFVNSIPYQIKENHERSGSRIAWGYKLMVCTQLTERRTVYVNYQKNGFDIKKGQCLRLRGKWGALNNLKVFFAKSYERLQKYEASEVLNSISHCLELTPEVLKSDEENSEFAGNIIPIRATIHNVTENNTETNAITSFKTNQFLHFASKLHQIGIPGYICYAAWRKHPEKGYLEKVLKNPYHLQYIDHYITFKELDHCLQEGPIHIDVNDPSRCQGLVYSIMDDCHDTFISYQNLINKCLSYQPAPNIDAIDEGIHLLQKRHIIARIEDPISDEVTIFALTSFCKAEREIANKLATIKHGTCPELETNCLWHELYEQENIWLSDDQTKALKKAAKSSLMFLTGGAGTGKTTVIRSIAYLYHKHNVKITLLAPTGKAADKLREVTGLDAQTIDSFILHSPTILNNYQEAIVVDESSMISMEMMHDLLKLLPDHCRLIFSGDSYQLPPVNAGEPFADCIRSGHFETARLKSNHRQGPGSTIAENANKIREYMPQRNDLLILTEDDSFKIVDIPLENKNQEEYYEEAIKQVKLQILIPIVENCALYSTSNGYVFPSESTEKDNTMFLAPTRKGQLGSMMLNAEIQQLFGPLRYQSLTAADGQIFRQGDRVMQLKNRSSEGVFNGMIGKVIAFEEKKQLVVQFQNGTFRFYGLNELGSNNELTLAYALTVHKSQGSEFDTVVLVLDPFMKPYINRTMLYTAITRAKQKMVIIGPKYMIQKAVEETDKPQSRLEKQIQIQTRKWEKHAQLCKK